MFQGKKILVIGGTGTIGRELVKRLAAFGPAALRVFSRDEYKQFMMQQELKDFTNIRYLLGDVRDKSRLDRAMNDIDIVFDIAALKHVPACEYNPFEAVKTNVIGTENVIECSIAHRVEHVIYTSSDKAVSPTNTMGATKLLAERLISSADYSKGGDIPIFAAVRFGNVLGSRGSVIPLWQEQIGKKRCITVTDPDMTRFMMTVPQAIELLIKAFRHAKGGEVFVLKMPVIRLGDLAQVVINHESVRLGIDPGKIEIAQIGLRPGEKIYEELMTAHESSDAIEYDEMFAILPHHKVHLIHDYHVPRAKIGEYSSHHQSKLTVEEIHEMLVNAGVFAC